ncbi:hypothetical protein O181_007230 [Austropuccinia psidii MF-1]|uniref:Integrase catalytic domain-containing protein n=1 Tax=Austropuccinia psidii MF-1 TaxID=1389203 RepID=A0A9Q3GHN2_9BASI|nr:hypothetical protein [Austropuccinia psidii MF-1]
MSIDKNLWHNRLGHPRAAALKNLGLSSIETQFLICEINKAHQLPFSHHFDPVQKPMDSIHIDLVGPITRASVSVFKYLLTIVHQSSSFKIMKSLRGKSEIFHQFAIAKNFMEKQKNRKIKKLTSDCGGEFINEKFKNLAEDCGFTYILFPLNTPQHNGYVERTNQTILEKARCLMSMANLPNQYWSNAVNTLVFLSNLSPTPSRENSSPYQLCYNCLPRLTRLKTFGCRAVIYKLKNQRNCKLAPLGQEGILLGFENENIQYRILRLADLKVVITRNVTLNKNIFPHVLGGKRKTPWITTNIPDKKDEQLIGNSPSLSDKMYSPPATNNHDFSEGTMEQTSSDSADLPDESFSEGLDTSNIHPSLASTREDEP